VSTSQQVLADLRDHGLKRLRVYLLILRVPSKWCSQIAAPPFCFMQNSMGAAGGQAPAEVKPRGIGLRQRSLAQRGKQLDCRKQSGAGPGGEIKNAGDLSLRRPLKDFREHAPVGGISCG